MISFSCPTAGCSGQQNLGDELAGQMVICPSCLSLVRVPGGVVAKKASSPAVVAKLLPKPVVPQKPTSGVTAPPTTQSPAPSAVRPPAVDSKEKPRRWFYSLNGATCGPVSEPDMKVLADDDRIFAHTLVWTESQVGWQPAGGVLPRFFKGASVDDLLPPLPRWQPVLGILLICVAMAAVMGAGVTFLLTRKSNVVDSKPPGSRDTPTSGLIK
jgi:hypothetical protein